MKKYPKCIFVTVRTASTRLPQKCLLKIAGTPVIEHLIHRLKRCREASQIVLCTTTNLEDKVLVEIAERNGILSFCGSEHDKLGRWHAAAEHFGVDFIVTADGDDPFCEPELIDLAFRQSAGGADFIQAPGLVCGAFTYGIRASALAKVCQIKGTDDTEMMWPYFTDTGLFKVETLQGVEAYYRRPEVRATLDYPEDFEFFRNIIEHFTAKGKNAYTMRDILHYLDEKPEVIQINQHLQEKFLANQKAKTKVVLKEQR
ncbi:MAG: cytidylyltransferase domain-containing protein [Bdellovibrionota bacterium]